MKRTLALILLMAFIAFARTAVPFNQYRPFEIKIHNINNIECCVSNYGKFGQSKAGNAGLWWPKGSGQNYIFGAGSWFGTIDGTDTLVTIGYGPHGGEAEYTPGLKDMSSGDPNAVIFFYPSPWPPPADIFPMAPQVNKSHQDSWCAYNDLDINQHIPGDTRPIGLEVYQTVYAWNLTTTADIIFIRYELKNVSGKKLTNCYFGVCTDNDIGNESGSNANDIISGIVGQWYVIEGESIWVDNLGYQWQVADESGWPDVGAIGFDYLQSPWDLKPGQDKDKDSIPDEYERDSSYYAQNVPPSKWDVDGDGTPDWRDPSEIPQLGMTAFKRFTLNLEPNKDNERYVTLAGYNFKTGEYTPFDTMPPQPDDQRFLQCSGPFELDADSIAIVLVGVMLTYWPRGVVERPDTALAKVDRTVQYIYDMNWLLPGPPPPPRLTCVPGDCKISLIWDNFSEITGDPYYDVVGNPSSPNYDPYYKKYDFEGYRVWRSPTGKAGTWKLLASYDLTNGIVFKDTIAPDSIALSAIDNGLVHSFIDTDVRNGFTYYYAVTAFDYNYVKGTYDSVYLDTFYIQPGGDTVWDYDTIKVLGPTPLYFESGMVGMPATPRRDPADYVPPGVPVITSEEGNPLLGNLVNAVTSLPLEVDSTKPIYIQFSNPDTVTIKLTSGSLTKYIDGLKSTVYLLDYSKNKVDSITYTALIGGGYGFYEFQPLTGISAISQLGSSAMSGAVDLVDTVEVGGSYPANKVGHDVLCPIPNITTDNYDRGLWAYRGNDYKVEWRKSNPSGKVNTVIVTDVYTGDTIQYKRFSNADSTRHFAEGWCFSASAGFTTPWPRSPSDTIKTGGVAAERTKMLYVNGIGILLNAGQAMVDTIRPSEGDVWYIRASKKYLPNTVYGLVKIAATPGTYSTEKITLNVKVVPNPYLIHNEWQQSSLIRRLRFINLPSDCVIRIFTLNGDLVKTIVHKATIGTVQGDAGGDEWWDLLTENRQLVASGVYIFHVDSKVGQQTGKFVVIR